MKLLFPRDALNEMIDAANFYEKKRPGLARRFDAAIETAFQMILANPESGRKYVNDVRKYRLRKFPYSVFYRIMNDTVIIVSVMHTSQRPDYWLDRL